MRYISFEVCMAVLSGAAERTDSKLFTQGIRVGSLYKVELGSRSSKTTFRIDVLPDLKISVQRWTLQLVLRQLSNGTSKAYFLGPSKIQIFGLELAILLAHRQGVKWC